MDSITTHTSPSKEHVVWETQEYVHRPKSRDWFFALGIIAIAGAAAAFMFGNFLFAILIVIGAFTLALFAARAPEDVTITLTERGILIEKRLYLYSSLESFWVSLDTEPAQLILKLKSPIMPLLMIPIENISPDTVRVYLTRYLEEKERETNPFGSRIAEYLGF